MNRHYNVVRFKEECAPHRIDCPLERKQEEGTRAEEKPIRDTACWLHEKELFMSCDSYWGGCHGFRGHSVISFLSKIGITDRSWKVASYRLQTTVQYASVWIWSRAKSLQHEWSARGITIPVWLHNIKKWLL